MRFKELLEAQKGKVILVDFQPAYDTTSFGDGPTWYTKALGKACDYINSNNATVLAFYNGLDVGIEDTQSEVHQHYVEHGLDTNANIEFREKGYAFLRSWMDLQIPPSTIITVLREMMRRGFNDSRDFDEDELEKLVGDEWSEYMYDDAIYIPDIAIAELKTFNNALIGGGGRDECLREIELLMSAYNIRSKRVRNWMYG